MPVLTARDVSHRFGDRVVADGASMTIQRGERVGLVGQNGAGKSTLVSFLAGTQVPEAGEVSVRKGASVGVLSQEVDFGDADTPRQYILRGMREWSQAHDRYEKASALVASDPSEGHLAEQAAALEQIERHGGWDVMHRVDEVASHVGVTQLDQPLSTMSGGERRRTALAQVLVQQPDLAVLDEPTNHLDVSTIEWLEEHLLGYPGAILLITHDRYLLDRVAQRTVELDRGKLHSYPGGWESYLLAKAEREAHEARSEANRQNLLRRELDWLKRSPKARTTKSQARVDRAEALRDAVPTKVAETAPMLMFESARTGKTILELQNVSLEIAGTRLVNGLDLVLKKGDRVGVIGKNGAGKTTLLRAVLGDLEAADGKIVVGKNTKFAYFDQERADLDDEATILENIADNQENVVVAGHSLNAKSYLARFRFAGDRRTQKVKTLSGGERARVAMAKFLLTDANVLVLDEPTNDLDVETLASLEEMLVETQATVVFVTHDRYFLDRLATRVVSFEGNGVVENYADGAQALRALRKQVDAPKKAKPEAAPKPKQAKKGLTYPEQHELKGLMPKIEAAEADLAALESQLADPELYEKRGAEVPALQAERDAAAAVVEGLVTRWEELEEKRTSD